METKLSVIIVNYNTTPLLVQCLSSLAFDSLKKEVIVIDNCSPCREGLEQIEKFADVRLIQNSGNLGFGKACNRGIELATGDFFYFLNPDTTIRPDCSLHLIDFMEKHPEIGLCGTRITNPNGSTQDSHELRYPGHRFARRELADLPGKIAWILGASLLVRKKAMTDLGGFDEDFFLYGEDTDICLRARKLGWQLGIAEQATVCHLQGQSERETPPLELWRKKTVAEQLFYRKHYLPETVRRIYKNYRIKARWRILSLTLSLPLTRNREQVLAKRARYQMELELFGRT